MNVYITYCCKDKRTDEKKLSAIDRYISERIKFVNSKAEEEDAIFFILSGKFGLLLPTDKIEYYDKLLDASEVKKLAVSISEKLNKFSIDKIVLFHYNMNKDKNIKQYYNTIKIASELSNIKFEAVEIDIE